MMIKYAGEHSCFVGPNVKPMDIQLVRKYFESNPSGTPEWFRDFVITQAMNENQNINEVAMQYADLTKIYILNSRKKRIQMVLGWLTQAYMIYDVLLIRELYKIDVRFPWDWNFCLPTSITGSYFKISFGFCGQTIVKGVKKGDVAF